MAGQLAFHIHNPLHQNSTILAPDFDHHPMKEAENYISSTKTAEKKWYVEWFDSPYYHLLYQHRDEGEARRFIDQLMGELHPLPAARVLDLACGQGRYSRYLASKGFDLTGIDLSRNNISYARQFEEDRLSFFTHDMRKPFRVNYFDYIFNFFTSFGYFDSEEEDLQTLRNVRLGLRPTGTFVMDFFNSRVIINQLRERETKVIKGIRFDIRKYIDGQRVIKVIEITDKGRRFFFTERVRLFMLPDLERLFRLAGLKIISLFGNYQLESFNSQKSPRLILVAKNDDSAPGI